MTMTCGECKHYKMKSKPLEMGICNSHENKGAFTFANSDACDCFKSRERARVITYGDKIRQGDNRKLAHLFANPCPPGVKKKCKGNDRVECENCWLAYLNAPAESEVEDE